jgi:hypothetical protein
MNRRLRRPPAWALALFIAAAALAIGRGWPLLAFAGVAGPFALGVFFWNALADAWQELYGAEEGEIEEEVYRG